MKIFCYPGNGFFKWLMAVLIWLLSWHPLWAQDKGRDIQNAFIDFTARGIKEKLYLHTDKDFYMAGEIIWFKIYNTDATFNKPISLSTVAYVELLDESHMAVLQAKIALRQHEGNGSLYLPQNLVSGNYTLRAYTNWMKNDSADWFFEKKMTIVNVKKFQENSVAPVARRLGIDFFPEGGNLVNGIQSRVGFKAADQYGKSFAFTGYLLDNRDTVLRFTPTHEGMGHFVFTPLAGHQYTAVIRPGDGASFQKALPSAYNSGYAVNVSSPVAQNLEVNVQTNISSAAAVYLVVHTRGSMKLAERASIANGKASFRFSESLLGEGVSQFTVFNEAGQPVCERLFFKRPANPLSLKVATHQPAYSLREKIDIDVSAALSATDSASLSMAVVRIDSLSPGQQPDILSYLWLSSDLKGYIENPGYYFSEAIQKAALAADDLMLTQGWRRFKWEDVLTHKEPLVQFPPELNGHIITGRILDSTGREPVQYITAYVSALSPITQFKTSESDKNGKIKAEISNFFGGSTLVVQTNPLIDKQYKIEVNSPFSRQFTATQLAPLPRPVPFAGTLQQQYVGMQVQNLYHSTRLNQFSFPYSTDTASFYVQPDYRYDLDRYVRFTSLEEVLREYVLMVSVRRRNREVHLPVINAEEHRFYSTDPLNLLDGIPVFDLNKFLEFDALKVKTLDVVGRRYLTGTALFEGILNWKTYAPNIANYTFAPGTLVMDYEGLQMKREFYAPVYDNEAARNSRLPDFRNVLYWSPDVSVKSGSPVNVHFYASDLPGKYLIVVQGLSENGVCGSASATFEVQK